MYEFLIEEVKTTRKGGKVAWTGEAVIGAERGMATVVMTAVADLRQLVVLFGCWMKDD